MKVKMLVNTNYKGFRQIDEEVNVPKEVGLRWIKKGIAAYVDEVEEEDTDDELDFTKMSTKQLYKYCVEQGLEVEPKKNKEYYLEAIQSIEAE